MATTFVDYTGDGNATKSFSFPSIKEADIKVEVDNVIKTSGNHYNITSYTTTGGGNVVFTSGNIPSSPAQIRIFRDTDVDSAKATFTAGSSVKANDLNNNMTQILYAAQEEQNQTVITSDIKGAAVTTAKIKDANVTTAKIADANVTTAKIATDAITNDKIADDAVRTAHIFDGQVTTGKIADSAVTTARIADSNVTTAKIADDAVTNAKIADDAVQEAQLANGAVTTNRINNGAVTSAKIADGTIQTVDIADDAITTAKIGNNAVTTNEILNGAITSAKIDNGTIQTVDIADSQITSAKIADGTVATGDIADGAVTTAKIADGAVTTAKLDTGSVTTAKIGAGQVILDKLADNSVNTTRIIDDAVTSAKIANNAVTTDKIADSELTTLAGMQSGTASKLADSTALTADIADLNQIDGMAKQTTITDDDTKFPTSGAVVDYVAAQLEPFGGFEAIANESSFPNTQPVSGVVISIADAGGMVVSGSGTASGATVGGTTVNITGIASNFNGTTITNGVRFLVVSTGSSQNYTYHKATLREDDLASLSGDINDFSERYRVGASNPTTSLDNGDLFFNTGSGKLLVYNGNNSAWEETQSVGNFFINTISSSSATGGGSATPNGTAYRFTLSNAGANAQQHIVSVDGVIQKPNSGTSQPSEGFAIDGGDIIFGSAPVNGASLFVITIGASVSIGTPSNNTVTTDILQNGAVTTAKITDANVTRAKIADDAIDHTKLANPAVNEAALFNNAVTTNKIADGNVTTAKIADDAVTAAKLANTSVTAGSYGSSTSIPSITIDAQGRITAASGNTVNTDLVGDTSPQLGGDLDTNSFEIKLDDDHHVVFGNDDDLKIKHSGSNGNINNYTGDLVIRTLGSGDDIFIDSNDDVSIRTHATDNAIKCIGDGGVELYYDASKKFQTHASGIQFFGNIKNETDGSDQGMFLGAANDFQFYHDGNRSAVNNRTGDLRLLGAGNIILGRADAGNTTSYDEQYISCTSNGAVELYHNNNKKLETTSTGLTCEAETFTIQSTADVDLIINADTDNTDETHNPTIQLKQDGSTTSLKIGIEGNAGTTYSNSGQNTPYILTTTSSNLHLGTNNTANWFINTAGDFKPTANGSYDIGSTTNRVANIYTNDLHLSNEGHTNSVDGTWGDWTIQEGESDLFLKNNRSGKKYKFNLTEVS